MKPALSSLLFYVSNRDMSHVLVNGQLVPFDGDAEPDLFSETEVASVAFANAEYIVQVWSGANG